MPPRDKQGKKPVKREESSDEVPQMLPGLWSREEMELCGMFEHGLEERTEDEYAEMASVMKHSQWAKAFQINQSRQHGSYLEQCIMDTFMANV